MTAKEICNAVDQLFASREAVDSIDDLELIAERAEAFAELAAAELENQQ